MCISDMHTLLEEMQGLRLLTNPDLFWHATRRSMQEGLWNWPIHPSLAILLYHESANIQDTVTDHLRNGIAHPVHTAVRFMLGHATRVVWTSSLKKEKIKKKN